MTVPLLRRQGYAMRDCISAANPLSLLVALSGEMVNLKYSGIISLHYVLSKLIEGANKLNIQSGKFDDLLVTKDEVIRLTEVIFRYRFKDEFNEIPVMDLIDLLPELMMKITPELKHKTL